MGWLRVVLFGGKGKGRGVGVGGREGGVGLEKENGGMGWVGVLGCAEEIGKGFIW